MDYIIQIIISFTSGGALVAFANKFFISPKEAADYGLELVKEMYKQHEAMRDQLIKLEAELNAYKGQYDALLKDHNLLQGKYEKLKADFEQLKNNQP